MILICPSSNMMNWTPLVSDPIKLLCILKMGLRSWHNGKESACWCKRRRFIPSLGWADPLKEEMATHSIILAWRISWTEETGRLQSTRLERVRHKLKSLSTGKTVKLKTGASPKEEGHFSNTGLCNLVKLSGPDENGLINQKLCFQNNIYQQKNKFSRQHHG